MTTLSRCLAHALVLLVAIGLTGYASIDRDTAASRLHLGATNAEGLALGEGGTTGSVELGRAGTIVKPIAVPRSPQVRHTPLSYTVQRGDDVYSLARRFGVSANDVRWSNPQGLTRTDVVTPGQVLLIPPVPGVVVRVGPQDSLQSLAAAYRVSTQAIADFNYLRGPEQLVPGQLLVLPNGQGPQLWPRRASDEPPHMGPFPNSKFVFGQCTWYAASRRYVPWTGDAWQWYANAKAMGYPVGQTPEPGAFMVTWESNWYGHVAYVEQVNEDGSFIVSEMNYKAWDAIDTRLIKNTRDIPLIGFIYGG